MESGGLRRASDWAFSEERPRVAVVYTHFPHYRLPIFRELLRSRKFSFELFFDRDGVDNSIVSGTGSIKAEPLRTRRFGPILFQPGILRLVVGRPFDVYILLGNPFIVSNWIAAVFLRARKRKVVFWTHGWLRKEEGWKGRLRYWYYRLSNGLLIYGERARQLGSELGFPENDLFVIYNSLDYETQKRIRNSKAPVPEFARSGFFLCVSRLVEAVQLDLAFRAMGALKESCGFNGEFVVVGDGPLRRELEELGQREGVNVRFLGAIYDEAELACLFLNCIAVVSPGKVGLLAMHALGYGVPVITHSDFDHQMPEAEAIIEGVTGQFFLKDDPLDLARKMEMVLRDGISEEGRKIAIETIEKKYTAEVQLALIEDALMDIIG